MRWPVSSELRGVGVQTLLRLVCLLSSKRKAQNRDDLTLDYVDIDARSESVEIRTAYSFTRRLHWLKDKSTGL